MQEQWFTALLLAAAGVWAGAQNALAGGGSFVTLPALVLAGLDPKLANIASAVALYPAQVISAAGSKSLIHNEAFPSLPGLYVASLAGGGVGSMVLLLTPDTVFDWFLPWLILFATGIFALGRTSRPAAATRRVRPRLILAAQFLVAIYGGYYGGGVGFLMLALLGFSQIGLRGATAIKNMLVAIVNSSAVLIFVLSTRLPVEAVVAVGTGAIAGTLGGVWLLKRVHEKILTLIVIFLGLAFSTGLFIRAAG